MSDSHLTEFYERVARLERARQRGHGFEAPGTLGRSHYLSLQPRKRGFLIPFLLVVFSLVGLKAAIYAKVGAVVYEARVEKLLEGREFSRLGGLIMDADPVTLYLSPRIAQYLR